MLEGRRIVVVLPAYNAAKTLRQTLDAIPRQVVDEILLTDDASRDDTVNLSRSLGIPTLVHERNRGYGGNQKTCYRAALEMGADIVVMLHADYQYSPRLVPAMASMIASGEYDVVLGSRILGKGALAGGIRFTNTLQTARSPSSRTSCSARSCQNITQAIVHGADTLLRPCRSNDAPMTSSSTTKPSRWRLPGTSGSGKFPARHATSKRLHRSISAAA